MFSANILGPDAIVVLLLAVVLLFGANQLPKLARSVGEASREFKKSQEGETDNQARAAGSPVASVPGRVVLDDPRE